MNDTPTAKVTPASIVYSTDAHGLGHATLPGNTHELVWHLPPGALLGDVTLDDQTRPCGRRFDEHAFHVFAETYFQVRNETPAGLLAWIERAKAGAL